MNRIFVLAIASAAGVLHAVVPTVNTGTVTLVQDENTRIVTVSYDLENAPGIVTVDFLTNGVSIGAENFQNVWGDVNRRLEAGTGKKLFWPGRDRIFQVRRREKDARGPARTRGQERSAL